MSAIVSQPLPMHRAMWEWIKRRPLQFLPVVGMVIALLAFAGAAAQAVARGNAEPLFVDIVAHSYVLVWMLVASITVRTVGVREVMMAFLSGFFLSTFVAYLVSAPLLDVLGPGDLTTGFLVPIVEEVAKALPILLLLWAYHRRRGQDHGITDLVVVGFAVGAGMTIHEDLLYGRTVVSQSGELAGAFLAPWGGLFPSIHTSAGGLLIAHSGWGAMIGLGLALASVYRRKWVLALCLAVVPVLLAVVDHSAWNLSGDAKGFFNVLAADNRLALAVLVLAIPVAITWDVLRRRRTPPDLPVPRLRHYPTVFRGAGEPVAGLLRTLAYSHYRRGWTSAAYDRARRGPDAVGDYSRLKAWLDVAAPQPASEKEEPKVAN